MKKQKTKKNKQTILKGEGANQHTLYGKIEMQDNHPDFAEVSVLEETHLKHEQPDGSFGEHNTLKVDKGDYVMGKQVEYNPFQQTINQIWD
jgi:hypothetical protein